MRRYCLIKDIEADSFPEEDKENYIDISIAEIIQHIVESREQVKNIFPEDYEARIRINGFFGNYTSVNEIDVPLDQATEQRLLIENEELVKSWRNIFYSIEYELDILDDIYLILSYLQNEEEKLFFEENPDINDKMKETIKNVKKSEKNGLNRYAYIFDVNRINSVRKDLKISKCGSGIVRLWLFDKKFRNLFVKTETSYEKYRPREIYSTLENDKKLGIECNKSDFIIMEKLLGIRLENTLYDYIICLLESKENTEFLQLLIDELMKYNGERSRCVIIQYIGFALYALKISDKKYNEIDRISIYKILIQIFRKEFNDVYMKTVSDVLEEYKKYFSITTCKQKVLEKIKILSQLGRPLYLSNPVYQSIIKKQNDLNLIKQITQLKDENQQLNLLATRDQAIVELGTFYTENNRWRGACFDNTIDESIRTQIQKKIIVNNYIKYSKVE